MKKAFFAVLLISVFSGCASSIGPDLILLDYETVVFSDGITAEEAIFISKKEARDKTLPDEYSIEEPKIVTEFESVSHTEDYWFITFPELGRTRFPDVFMVITRKSDGKIMFSRPYRVANEFVLEAFFLKLYEKQKRIEP